MVLFEIMFAPSGKKAERQVADNMLEKCYSGAVNGVDARTVEIEVYSAVGTSQFAIVGLPDTAVKEAKDRIPTALKNQGLASKKEFDVTVNLARKRQLADKRILV